MERAGDEMVLSVIDDGRGLDPAETALADPRRSRGFGLFSIRSRLSSFGGTVKIATSPEGGTVATLRVPLSRPNAEGDER